MATNRQTHKQKNQLHRHIAYVLPASATSGSGVNVQGYQQILNNGINNTLPLYDLIIENQKTTSDRRLTYELQNKVYSDILGVMNLGANPIIPSATKFGVESSGGRFD